MIPQWEYDIEDADGSTLSNEVEQLMLGKRGKDRWEMTGVVFYPRIGTQRFYFKRELPPEPEESSDGK